jgi:hypothetical protein
MRRLALSLAVFLGAVTLWAQAPAKPPAPPAEPTPRGADGHPILGSTPTQKGYWEVRPGGSQNRFPRAADMPLQPWARALTQYRQQATELYPPGVNCKPTAGPSSSTSPRSPAPSAASSS